MGDTKIKTIWDGTTNKKFVADYNKDMLVQPAVAIVGLGHELTEMCIYTRFYEMDSPQEMVGGWYWGLVLPHNLVATWRGCLIVEVLDTLKNEYLCYSYYAARHSVHGSDIEKVDVIKQLVNKKTYSGIMKKRIPDWIVKYVLDEVDEDAGAWQLQPELDAGTLLWDDYLSEFGLKKPKLRFRF